MFPVFALDSRCSEARQRQGRDCCPLAFAQSRRPHSQPSPRAHRRGTFSRPSRLDGSDVWTDWPVSISSAICSRSGARTCRLSGGSAAGVNHDSKLPLGDCIPVDLWSWHHRRHDVDHHEHRLRVRDGRKGRENFSRRLAVASGLLSLGFGLFVAYQICFVNGLFTSHAQWIPR